MNYITTLRDIHIISKTVGYPVTNRKDKGSPLEIRFDYSNGRQEQNMPTFYSQSWTEIMHSLLNDPSFYSLLCSYDQRSFRERVSSIPRDGASLTLCISVVDRCSACLSPNDKLLASLQEAKRRILFLQELEKETP